MPNADDILTPADDILPNADDILPSSKPLQMTRWWPSSSRLQMTHDSSSTHLLQRLSLPNSLLQKMFPAEDPREFPAEADFGPLAIFETRSLSTSLKSVRRGTKCTLMFSTYCMYCIARALHCIALHCFEL